METLYERIKYLCDSKGVKPGKMCADTGVSKGLISDLKFGRKKTITIETAQKMAKYLDVPVDIITGDGDKEESLGPEWMDSEVYEAMVKFKKLSSIQKKAVVQIIDTFLMC